MPREMRIKINTDYLNDENLQQIKIDLAGVIVKYLEEYYGDLRSKETFTWMSKYHTSFKRFFSFRGGEGFYRALTLLKIIDKASNLGDLMVDIHINLLNSTKLRLLLLRVLFRNGICDSETVYSSAYSDYTQELDAVIFSPDSMLERQIKSSVFWTAWGDYVSEYQTSSLTNHFLSPVVPNPA